MRKIFLLNWLTVFFECGVRFLDHINFWAGEQILLIYGKDQWISEQKLTLNDVFIDKNNINSQSHELHRQHEEIAELNQRLKGLKDNSQSAQAEFEKRLADVIHTSQEAQAGLEKRLADVINTRQGQKLNLSGG